jgi:adenylate kinase family enzyme
MAIIRSCPNSSTASCDSARSVSSRASPSAAVKPKAGSLPADWRACSTCSGTGSTSEKSHLARELGALLGNTPVHLDGLYYDRGWKPLDQEQFAALQRDLVTAPPWIIDGNYASTVPIRLQAADTVVFLDLPAWACLWGVVQRRLQHGGGQHDAIGVYDRITWNFIRYVAGYRRQMAPRPQLIASRRHMPRWLFSAIAVLFAASSPTWPY